MPFITYQPIIKIGISRRRADLEGVNIRLNIQIYLRSLVLEVWYLFSKEFLQHIVDGDEARVREARGAIPASVHVGSEQV